MMHTFFLRGPIVLFGVITVAEAQGLLPLRTTGPGYDGVIIRVNEQEPSGRNVSGESCCQWTPTEAQVREAEVVKKGGWRKTAVGVAGGGDDYFQVTYHVERRRFSNLRVNAPL
jgi:hypothetical protein